MNWHVGFKTMMEIIQITIISNKPSNHQTHKFSRMSITVAILQISLFQETTVMVVEKNLQRRVEFIPVLKGMIWQIVAPVL